MRRPCGWCAVLVSVAFAGAACGSAPKASPTAPTSASVTGVSTAPAVATSAGPPTTGVWRPSSTVAPLLPGDDWLEGARPTAVTGPCRAGDTTFAPLVVAVDSTTGTPSWQLCPARPAGAMDVVVDGDLVVVWAALADARGDHRQGVAALDRTSGALRWQRPMVGLHGIDRTNVYVAPGEPGEMTSILALDRATGAERWTRDGGRFVPAAAVVDSDLGFTLVGTTPDSFQAVDVATGRLRWVDASGLTPMAVGDDEIVLASEGPYDAPMAVVDLATGTERWRGGGWPVVVTDDVTFVRVVRGHHTVTATTGLAGTTAPGFGPGPTSPPVAYEVYAFRIEARANADGRVLWSADIDGEMDGPVVVTRTQAHGAVGDVVVWRTDDRYQGRDVATGAVRWTVPSPNVPAPIGAGVSAEQFGGGTYVARDLATGAERWRLTLPCLGADGPACTLPSGYVQAWAARDGTIAFALNPFNGG